MNSKIAIFVSLFLIGFQKMMGQDSIFIYPKYEKIEYLDTLPKYKTKCKACYIDKITYTKSHVILSFRYAFFKKNNRKKEKVILYAQNSPQAWLLNENGKMQENEVVFLENMINVKADSTLLYPIVQDKQEIEFTKDENKIDNILCDLVFPLTHTEWKTMSLMEEKPPKNLGHLNLNGFSFHKIEIKYKSKYKRRYK